MISHQEKVRVNLGWQCPECAGVNTSTRQDDPGARRRFICDECGCRWGADYYPVQRPDFHRLG